MKAVTDTTYYNEIAKALQDNHYAMLSYMPSEMAQGVNDVAIYKYNDGYESGFREGYTDGEEVGYADGLTQGVVEGRQEQYDEFWDKYLEDVMNGGYATYMFGGSCWNSKTFYPPAVTIKPMSNMDGMFNRFSWGKTPYIDLAQRLEECGCVLDFSESYYSTGSMFSYCWVTRLPKLDFTANNYSFDRTFDNMQYLVTLDELVMPTKAVAFPNAFRNCYKLANIVITGTIAKSISFESSSKLTRDSILGKFATEEQIAAGTNLCTIGGNTYYGGIFGALSTTSSGETLTLSETAVNNAFETSEGVADGSISQEWEDLKSLFTNWTFVLS